ncbi:MAG: non-hydrolyzing UDP-N-acetylglucosamine 2-epimerase [Candidatus Neomarinimicrobiota bacterium]
MLKIMHVAGARPNFMKIAPIMRTMAKYPGHFEQVLVHTGQHYDFSMSQIFFQDLDLPEPDVYLKIGSGTHAEQTSLVMLAFEPIVQELGPDLVLVVGDVNSTLACTLVCAKLGVAVAHVEAGLRSYDMTMPEEINRVLTDQIATLLFTPSRDADDNLQREGIRPERIHFVGNVMIDSLVVNITKAQQRNIRANINLQDRPYMLATLHRPANVDSPENLRELLSGLSKLTEGIAVVFTMHPRTSKRIDEFGLRDFITRSPNFFPMEPQGYLDFLALMNDTTVVLTDSGGVQEETTYLGIPCLTVRPTTERPVTVELGTNRLIGCAQDEIVAAVEAIVNGPKNQGRIPELWDGHAAERIVKVLDEYVR